MKKILRKSAAKKTLTGTLGGVSDFTGIDYVWLRLIFAAIVLVTYGWAALAYLAAAIVMPSARMRLGRKLYLRSVFSMVKRFFLDFYAIAVRSGYSKMFGLIALAYGLVLAGNPLGVWPAVLLVLGTALLFNPFGLADQAREPEPAVEPWVVYSPGRLPEA